MSYNFYDPERRLVVGSHDTFTVPFNITNHKPLASEYYVFTIRRVLEPTKRMGQIPELGDIVFQKTISYNDLIINIDEGGHVTGCSFTVAASKTQAAAIPDGVNAYDLAIVTDITEFELVPPSEFIVGEVLRYAENG
jgi:hypothetical protein